MADQYTPCPCGSGKKFKWCCQPIEPGVARAAQLDEGGQHDAALKVLDQVIADHAGNPQAWGQKARLLYANAKPEQAEEALDKAFAISPDYPFGLMLRAKIRHDQGDFLGALTLARRSAEAYDPQAKEILAQLYYLIFDCEMRRNCPVAGRAALEQVMAAQPGDQEIRQGFDQVFGPNGRLPACASKKYDLRKARPARREAWAKAITGAAAKLSGLARAFEALSAQDASDGPAWFNLGVARAWLGENGTALDALDRYIDLEADENAAAEAAALGEVLRCGHGLEEKSDHFDSLAMLQFRNPEPINRLLNEWADARRLVPLQSEQENVFTALVLELSTGGLVTVGRPVADSGKLAAYLIVVNGMLRLSGPVPEPFERVRGEVRQKLALGLDELKSQRGPIGFHDVVTEAAVFPVGPVEDREKAVARAVEQAGQFYEETWIHRPRKSLNHITPADAAGSSRLRKKLLGVIAFIEDCARGGMVAGYSFDRLRGKLGLLGAAPAGTSPAAPAQGAGEPSDDQLEQAYQAARRDADEGRAADLARALVGRPVPAARPDRYPLHLFLVEKSLRDGANDEALDLVNEGERVDCEHNGGKRRDEYELLRARVHTKRGELGEARGVFERLIQRSPRDFEARGRAAKAMLDAKDAAAALKFAEEGVTAARQANNRDAEQMLMELSAAAKKAGA